MLKAARWNFLTFQSPTLSAVTMEFTTPPSYANTTVTVGGFIKDGEDQTLGGTATNTVTHVKHKEDPNTNWPEPTAVKYTWEGKTADGKDIKASLDKEFPERMDCVDVMSEVPAFIKKVVAGAAGTRPYIYQVIPSTYSWLPPRHGSNTY